LLRCRARLSGLAVLERGNGSNGGNRRAGQRIEPGFPA
jgi:hypothetical protein